MKNETDIKIEELHKRVNSLLNKGIDEETIISELQKDNIDPAYTRLLIENSLIDDRDRRDFWKLIIMGLFFIIGGSLINYFSYSIATRARSNFFYVYWGIIALGIIFLIRAFSLYRKSLFRK